MAGSTGFWALLPGGKPIKHAGVDSEGAHGSAVNVFPALGE